MTYEKIYNDFDWHRFCDERFDWDWQERFNITRAAVDRNAADEEKIAIYHVQKDMDVNRITYSRLTSLTNKFANMLLKLGLEKGDRVARLLPRIPEAYVSFFGTWKSGMVDVPLYTAFGSEAIAYRLVDSGAKILVTNGENLAKLAPMPPILKDLKIIIVEEEFSDEVKSPYLSYRHLMKNADAADVPVLTCMDDPALLVYTSGTTGPPKGTTILHKGIVSVLPYATHCLDVRKDDMYWGFADPGWTYGLLSAGSAIMTIGGSLVVFEPRFEAETWYRTIVNLGVTNFTAAPTAFRAIMAAGEDLARQYAPQLRYL